jgi:hypothetical protein
MTSLFNNESLNHTKKLLDSPDLDISVKKSRGEFSKTVSIVVRKRIFYPYFFLFEINHLAEIYSVRPVKGVSLRGLPTDSSTA